MSDRKTVLIVDDDPFILRGLKRLLRENGFDTVLFDSAAALRSHDDFKKAFCIVIDIDLNLESGIELRHELRASGVSLPVIYITGNDSPTTRVTATQSGCLAYLTKPFLAKSLIEPLERALAGVG